MSAIKGVLFDKDGTLFDFATTWEAWAIGFLDRLADGPDAAAHLGAQIGFDYHGGRFTKDSIAIAGTPGDVALALHPHMSGYTQEQILDLLNDEAAKAPQAEAVPLVPFLSGLIDRGLRLGVATNDAEAPTRAHLDAAHILDRFAFIAGFDSGYGCKPDTGQLIAFARAISTDTAAIVMVGDSTHDLLAGRAAGMRCVGVLTGLAERSVLEPHADAVFDDIGFLPDWIDAQQG
ncbi:Phosphoglycolate phosphatase [Roseobacter fucihabitans]|uniref:phosphoglycolate phosphatase n=1 Tax=Roseobacter fucihabitans TaxID=1537242 RepID=A0ABZ2BSX3_9RHOB|nr:HAD family hydrolase [Roseobacter litoralis]MBC6967931.1 Pyrophosphatase PpaX [Roseobacter litoralis]